MNRGAFGFALTNASTNLGTHVHGITSFCSFSCNLNLSFQRNLDEIRKSVPRFPLPAIRGTEPSFTWQRTNFLTGWKNLTGHFVHPEPFNIFALFTPNWRTRLNFNFFQSVVLLSAHAQSVTLADPKWRNLDPSASTRSHATNLDGPIRNTFIVFCWNPSRDNLAPGFPRALHPWPSCAEELWGRDCKMAYPCNYGFATQRFRR